MTELPTQSRTLPVPLIIALLFFLFIAPTLAWLDFSGGSENLNVATVLETRRSGHWWIPQLKGGKRLTKPPLTAWISCALVRERTLEVLSDPDPVKRDAAFHDLAWQIRLPALACSCAMLLAVYGLGKSIGSRQIGLLSMLICGSSLMFLRFSRAATTDVQLALWVSVANLFLSKAVLDRKIWLGFSVAGVALGLALMSKGPVALLQTVVPLGAFLLWRWLAHSEEEFPEVSPERRALTLPILLGLLLMLAIALPWPLSVLRSNPSIVSSWRTEVLREGATDLPRDPFWTYLVLIPEMLPWVAFFCTGLIMVMERAWRTGLVERLALPFCLVVVPVIVMSFFKDKNDRYLLPMIGPASILAAYALREQFKPRTEHGFNDQLVGTLHWATIGALAIGFPIAAATRYIVKTDYTPWLSPTVAGVASAIGAAIVGLGIAMQWRRRSVIVIVPVVVMLLFNVLFNWGYKDSFDGRSALKPVADAIWAKVPDAEVYYHDPRDQKKALPVDINIYLDRVVRSIADPTKLKASDRPQVFVMVQKEREPEPAPPAGWRRLVRVPWKERAWLAFERIGPAATEPAEVRP